MRTRDLRARYESLLRRRFPTICLRDDLPNPEPEGEPLFDVFCVPDARMVEFMKFRMDEVHELAQAAGLPPVVLISHEESATRRHYPGVCIHAGPRRRRSPRRASRARTVLAVKPH